VKTFIVCLRAKIDEEKLRDGKNYNLRNAYVAKQIFSFKGPDYFIDNDENKWKNIIASESRKKGLSFSDVPCNVVFTEVGKRGFQKSVFRGRVSSW
jgi:hypothetical protein